MAPPPPSSPPAPRSPPAPPQRHNRTGGSKGSASLSSRKSIDKTLPGIPGLPAGAASPSIVATPSPAILYPPIPVPTTIPSPPSSKTVQYPARPPNQLPPPVPTPPATSPSSAAPSRLTSLSSNNSKYAPSPLRNAPGPTSYTRQSSTSTTQSSDEGTSGNPEKLRKKKSTKKKAHSEDILPATLPVRYPSMVLSRLVREEAESVANSNWIGVPPQRSSTVPTNMGANRTRTPSMILYRLADEEDRVWATEGQLSRPASNHSLVPPPGNRFSANPRLTVSPSFDSKYPSFPVTGDGSPNSPPMALSGYATPPGSRPNSAYRNSAGTPPPGSTPLSQGVFLPYEYDPTEDEVGPNDSVDDLHHIVLELGSDGKYKFPKERMADLNPRGVMNVICIAFVISAILAVFLAYPVVDAIQRQQFYEAAQQGAVIVNPVPPKDGTSTAADASITDDGSILSSTDPLSTSRTRTRAQTTADPTPTDVNGDPITDPGLATPTPTPIGGGGLSTVDTSVLTDTGVVDPAAGTAALRKRIPQPSLPVIAARRERQARS